MDNKPQSVSVEPLLTSTDPEMPSVPPNHVHSRWSYIVLGVFGLLTLGLVGVIVFAPNQQSSDSTFKSFNANKVKKITITPVPTAAINISTWKTYTNTKYGYTFKFPETWQLQENKEGVYFENKALQDKDIPGDDSENGRVYGGVIVSTGNEYCGVACINLSEDSFYDLKDPRWKTGNVGGGGPGTTVDKVYESSVDSKKSMVRISHPTTSYEWSGPTNMLVDNFVYLGKSGNDIAIMNISFNYNQTNVNAEKELTVFNKIISTFKFTNQNQTTVSSTISPTKAL